MTSTIILLSGFSSLCAQEKGYWQLERIENTNKVQDFGQLTRKVSGVPGDLLYVYDNGSHSRLVAKGNWSALPEILIPNEEATVDANLKIDEFKPPKHHLSLQVSMSFVSFYSSGSLEDMKGNTRYCHSTLLVKASTTDDPDKNIPRAGKTVTIKAPESPAALKGELFIIKARMGSSDGYREYYYLYRWQADR